MQTDQIDSGQKVPVYFWSDWQKLADFARRACSLRCELVREKKLDPPIRLRLSNSIIATAFENDDQFTLKAERGRLIA